jgi:TfoX/Sxy family transcriptional regulator of competence genes
MAYDEGLAQRIREVLEERTDVAEKRMFGGVAFLVNGNMAVGVVKSELMVRVGPDAHAAALREPHARPMDFAKRPMKGFVFVAEAGLAEDAQLSAWVERGVRFAASLPPK